MTTNEANNQPDLFRVSSPAHETSNGNHASQAVIAANNTIISYKQNKSGQKGLVDLAVMADIFGAENEGQLHEWLEKSGGVLGLFLMLITGQDLNIDGLINYNRSNPSTLTVHEDASSFTADKPPQPYDFSKSGSANFEAAIKFVLKEEGGFNPNEPRGHIAKFGINSEAHPNVDVKNLTQSQAISIYKQDYWDSIPGINNMNQAQATAVFDTAVNCGAGRAKQWLNESGGNLETFMSLRQEHYDRLAQNKPGTYAQYHAGWTHRMDNLRTHIQDMSSQQDQPQAQLASNFNLESNALRATDDSSLATDPQIPSPPPTMTA